METPMHDAPKVITPQELDARRGEFDVPRGALEAFKAGASPVVVFLRDTGEPYQLGAPEDDAPPGSHREGHHPITGP